MEENKARVRRLVTVAAGTVTLGLAVALVAAPTASAQEAPTVVPPQLTASVDGRDVTLTLVDPHTGDEHAATICTAGMVEATDSLGLLMGLAAGAPPSPQEVNFYYGPSLETTTADVRTRTYPVPEVSPGIYVGVGICSNPADYENPRFTVIPILVGSPFDIGSAALDLGSAVLGGS